ncbi:hypothetical protein [Flavobacterium cerinum]|uniref:Sel1 repeat family protein n=1 Tax=Flavobacterium cerinum TaxID=2502784 RepID=A0A3S3SAC1_9FLAO|nr:hypothetical protein [Flavobacterium cerinum]RWW96700.1 hypothetical protein EPI11_13990 [Flavobacterium cerinum]
MKNYLLLLLLLVISCNEKVESKKNTAMGSAFYEGYRNEPKLEELWKSAYKKGDTISYLEMMDIFVLSGHENEFLYYAICMADKHNYRHANIEVYDILRKLPERNDRMNKIANYYLLRAIESGHKGAIRDLKERFGTDSPPKSEDYWKTIQ